MTACRFSDLLDEHGLPRSGAPLGAVMTAQALRDPDRPVLTAGVTITRAELDAGANRLARHYASFGAGQDDVVMIALPNGRAFYEAALAVWKLGATPAHVSYRLTEGEFAEIAALAEPKLIVGGPPLSGWRGVQLAADAAPDPGLSDAPLEPRAARSWKIGTTGGSTGRPKLVTDVRPAVWTPEKAALRREPDSTVLNPAPLYHAAPFSYIVPALLHGCHVVEVGSFDAERWLALVERHRPDWVYLVPTMMTRIARLPDNVRARYDLSSIRTLLHVASPCPDATKRFWIDAIGAEAVWEIYGGTERFGIISISGTEWLAHPGSVGRPGPGTEAEIRDEAGAPLPAGEEGEIFFRLPAGRSTEVRGGASAAAGRFDWASYGDLGWMDADGYIYIADRRADLIVCGGANLYPAEIEAALEAHPAVIGAVVVGLPDDDLGRRPHAVVQLASDAQGDVGEPELREHLTRLLARNKHPHGIEFTDRPIRDDAGKVRRVAWRDEIVARQERQPSEGAES